jgi:hypothetical protein
MDAWTSPRNQARFGFVVKECTFVAQSGQLSCFSICEVHMTPDSQTQTASTPCRAGLGGSLVDCFVDLVVFGRGRPGYVVLPPFIHPSAWVDSVLPTCST